MAQLDPRLMGTFRRRMMDPRCFHKVCGILRAQRVEDLRCHHGCCNMIDRLSECMGVPVSPAERENAAQWLMGCGVDPQNRLHRRQIGIWCGGDTNPCKAENERWFILYPF